MKIDLHSAIFANESHEYMFVVLYLPFFRTTNEGEAIIKNGAVIYLEFLEPQRNSWTFKTFALNNSPYRKVFLQYVWLPLACYC